MTIEHLRNARDELEQARKHAGVGTSMMIDEQLAQLNRLINRSERVNDDDVKTSDRQ